MHMDTVQQINKKQPTSKINTILKETSIWTIKKHIKQYKLIE